MDKVDELFLKDVENETKELLNKQFSLNDLDNEIMRILDTNESLFDDIYSAISTNSYSYFLDDEHTFVVAWKPLKTGNNGHLDDLVVVENVFIY